MSCAALTPLSRGVKLFFIANLSKPAAEHFRAEGELRGSLGRAMWRLGQRVSHQTLKGTNLEKKVKGESDPPHEEMLDQVSVFY